MGDQEEGEEKQKQIQGKLDMGELEGGEEGVEAITLTIRKLWEGGEGVPSSNLV